MKLIVDGTGLVCRLWWASPIHVPARFLTKIATLGHELNVDETWVAWDAPGRTWRRDLMPAYKSQRRAKPEHLLRAIASCKELELAHYEAPGFEADDVIFTLVARATLDSKSSVVLTEDKDLAQLVSSRVRLVNTNGEVMDEEDVEVRWGVPPDRIRHLLSWIGDKVDGLPGVKGVGKVRAIPRAMAGEIGDRTTFDLTELAMVPDEMMRCSG